jgi:hypothetical protein
MNDDDGVFTHPFMYWVGMDTDPRTTPEALAEFNRFYSTTHVGEVIAAHPGFVSVSRYELIEPANGSPRWLAAYEMADERAAEQYVKDNARPWLHRQKYSPWPPARKRAKTVWRLLWHQTAASDSADNAPDFICIVGTNEPLDAELATSASCARVTRHELYRDFAHPPPGAPRFLTICESAEASPEVRNEDAVWRLVYRRIPD